MTIQEKIVACAKQEVGYLEKRSNSQLDSKTANAGSANYNKYSRDLDAIKYFNTPKNSFPWCTSFVNWVLVQTVGAKLAKEMTGQPEKNNLGASSTSAVQYYKSIGRFYNLPQVGDQIFFTKDGGKKFNHTGLVTKVTSTTVYTIEGNTSSEPGVIDNGGCVREKSYPLNYNKIGGYGRPKYELVKEEEEVTQEDFNKMMNNYLATLAKEPTSAWAQADMAWAQSEGLMQGDATGAMQAQKFVTRQELATVLHRLVDDKK